MTLPEILYIYLFIINLISFLLYCWDKHKAIYGQRRIPEAVLWMLAIIGGPYGALMGMILFHHKTRHMSFLTIIPICFTLWICVLVALCIWG